MNTLNHFIQNLRKFKTFAGQQLVAAGRRLQAEAPKGQEDCIEARLYPHEATLIVNIDFMLVEGQNLQTATDELEYFFTLDPEMGRVKNTEIIAWENR